MTSGTEAGTLRSAYVPGDWIKFAVGVAAMCIAYALVLLPGETVDKLVEEDGIVEWIGSLGLFVGAALFLASFWLALRGPRREGLARYGVWFLLLMGIGLLFLGGEEISWGQRLFGWGTPESFGAVNAQDETTLHNLNAFQGTALDGDRLFRSAWMLFFFVLPVVAVFWPWLRRIRAQLLPVSVPLWLAGLFFMAWLLSAIADRTLDGAHTATLYALGSATTEIQEATVELLMMLSAVLTFRSVRSLRARRTARRT